MYVALDDETIPARRSNGADNNAHIASPAPAASSHTSPAPLVTADPDGNQRGIVVLDFVRSVSAVRSLPLFITSLCIFVFLFLVNGLQLSCRELREVDPAALSSEPCSTIEQRKAALTHYNDISGWEYWHSTLLHISFLPLFLANSRFNAPLVATLCFLPPLAAQGYMLFYQSLDLPWCTVDQLGKHTQQCYTPQREELPPLDTFDPLSDTVCEHWAQTGCELETAVEYQYTALIQISTTIALAVLMALTAWGATIAVTELVTRYTGRPFTSPLLNYRNDNQGPTCIALHRWIDLLYEKVFSSEAEDVANSQLDHTSPLYTLPYHLSLRIYFAMSVSFAALTAFVAYIMLLTASDQTGIAVDETTTVNNCLLAAVLISYIYSLVFMVVHIGAMRAAIKRLLFRLHTAVEHDTLEETLHQLRIRWFSMPFYAGSLLGSIVWTFLLLSAVLFFLFIALSVSQVRSALAPYVWRAAIGLLPPVLLLTLYRCCGTLLTFRRCGINPAIPLARIVPHPLWFLFCDWVGLLVGGWGSWVFIVQRLLLALPIAVSRIDIPTSSFDWVSQQFSAVAVCEAYRIFLVHKEDNVGSVGGQGTKHE